MSAFGGLIFAIQRIVVAMINDSDKPAIPKPTPEDIYRLSAIFRGDQNGN